MHAASSILVTLDFAGLNAVLFFILFYFFQVVSFKSVQGQVGTIAEEDRFLTISAQIRASCLRRQRCFHDLDCASGRCGRGEAHQSSVPQC